MTFETATQFPGKGKTRFSVFFQQGKAIEINAEKSEGSKP
jgi:hypothetical protein